MVVVVVVVVVVGREGVKSISIVLCANKRRHSCTNSWHEVK